jgi:hypothetical protein
MASWRESTGWAVEISGGRAFGLNGRPPEVVFFARTGDAGGRSEVTIGLRLGRGSFTGDDVVEEGELSMS